LFYVDRFRKKWQSQIEKDNYDETTKGETEHAVEVSEDIEYDDDDDDDEKEEEAEEEEELLADETRLVRPSDLIRRSSNSSWGSHNQRKSSHSISSDYSGDIQRHHDQHQQLNTSHSLRQNNDASGTLRLNEPAFLQEAMSIIAILGLVKVKDRRFHLRVFKKCFVGSQLVDVMMEHECASSRKEAVQLAQDINTRFRLFEHVVDNHQLKDEVSDVLYY
jgi:hypothetical protein